MLRRNAYGSLAGYGAASYDFTTKPAAGDIIKAEHGQKTIDLLLKIAPYGDLENVWEGEPIPDSFDTGLLMHVDAMAAEDMTGTSSCSSQCTGLCTTTCTTACTSCSGSCSGSCTNTCTGSCDGSCAAVCASWCTNGCSSSCTGSCTGTCTGICTSCSGNCTGQCLNICSGCVGGCTQTCAASTTISGCTDCGGISCSARCGNGCKGQCG